MIIMISSERKVSHSSAMNNSLSTDKKKLPKAKESCDLCGKEHNAQECDYVAITAQISDNAIPSRARLTLPEILQLKVLADGCHSVFTTSFIHKGTRFGPLQAERVKTLNVSASFPIKLFSSSKNGNSECYLDITDENKCNWLMFIQHADDFEEQNLACFQAKGEIYYVAIKDVESNTALKVWYSPHYSSKMDKPHLKSQPEIDPIENIDVDALIKEQQKIMDRKVWTCKFCGQIEYSIMLFAGHILKHYTARLKKTCEICEKTFNVKKDLNNHIKIVHHASNSKPTNRMESLSKTLSRDVSLGGPMLNSISMDSLDLPQNEFQQFHPDLENQHLLLDNDNLNVDHLLSENVKDLDHFNFEIDDSQKHFVCDICLKQFAKVKLLIIHLRRHTGDFVCFKCLKVFCRKENFKSHVCNLNSLYSCSLCAKNFTHKKYLSLHLKAIHLKMFSCMNCAKSYHSNKELLEHNCSKIPVTEKEKFVCSICDKSFFRNTYLKKHLRRHERESSSSVVCSICGLHMKNKSSYYLHKKTHEEPSYNCDICKKRFCRKDTLAQHLLCHDKHPKMSCPVCDKTFKTRKILSAHLRQHHSNVSYKCSLCTTTFKYRPNLNRHIKTSHKNVKDNTENVEYYSCPVCLKSIKLKSSLLRHLRKVHSDLKKIDTSCIRPKLFVKSQMLKKTSKKKVSAKLKKMVALYKTDRIEMEKVIEDENSNNDLDTQITDLLNKAETNSTIHKEAVESLVEELDISSKKQQKQAHEVCLSIPDLTKNCQELPLDKDAYIMENGTIVQPQEDADHVIIYVVDQPYS